MWSTELGRKSLNARYQIARLADVAPVDCPCGESRRAFVGDADQTATLHLVDIKSDAKLHYHKRLTEIYYILEGAGEMELDGERHAVQPGDAILIKPGCRHRAIGKMRVLNAVVPAFDADDEWFD